VIGLILEDLLTNYLSISVPAVLMDGARFVERFRQDCGWRMLRRPLLE
jgi:hypothetical protein